MVKIPLFLTAFTMLLCTGCFEIREEVNMNPDGSGSAILTVNLSESKQNLSGLMESGEVNGQQLPTRAEIEKLAEEARAKLSTVEGISNVTLKQDFTNFIFSVSCNFANVEALNQAINKMDASFNTAAMNSTNFGFSNETFRRFFPYPSIPAGEYDKMGTMERFVLETARMIQIYRFARPIASCDNPQAQLSPSGKAVKIEHQLSQLFKGESSLASEIRF